MSAVVSLILSLHYAAFFFPPATSNHQTFWDCAGEGCPTEGGGTKACTASTLFFGGLSAFALFNARQKGLASSANSVREDEDSFA